jgi:hypothetical protein
MTTEFLNMIPVLPSQNIERDVKWYAEQTGFTPLFADEMYAVLMRDTLILHLQWHADTADDPLLGGSVVRIRVKNIAPLFAEFVERKTVEPTDFRAQTAWATNEFGFYDLNKNAIFITEDT